MTSPSSPRLAASTCIALACSLLAAAPARAEEEKVLNVLNWSDYIADDMVANFEKETGIKVRYDVIDSNETLHAKLVAGHTGYDIVVPSSYFAKVQIMGGLFRPLDMAQIPNARNLDPELQRLLAQVDPGNRFLVDWAWGYTTLGINVDKVRKALGALPMPENAWDLVFKPEYMKRLATCGVSFLDSATDVVPAAARYLGKPGFSRNAADYAGVPPLLKAIRPHVTVFSSSGYINDLANGSICVALGWSGDINIAKNRAIEGKTGQKIECLIPRTGAIIFMDTMAVPADAPHPGNAMKWIDYYLRPEVSASMSNKVLYANPNKESKRFVKPQVANDPTVFLGPEDLKKMEPPADLSNDSRRAITRIYSNFKTGF